MNVLITSASRKVSLVRAFQGCLSHAEGERVIAVDVSPLSPALFFADEHHLVPRGDDPRFIPHMRDLCRESMVSLLVPTRDEELPLFAAHREGFAQAETQVMVAAPDTIETCQDKVAFIGFCRKNGFNVPQTFDGISEIGSADFPLFIKARRGKGSNQVVRVENPAELAVALERFADPIIQECLDLPEFTIDLFADFDGRVISVVPRERITIFGGESFVSKTVYDAGMIAEAAHLSEALGLVGHNTIQCFVDGSIIKFIEVNPRFGGAAHLGFAAGANTPSFLVDLMRGREVKSCIGEFRPDYVMLRYTEDLFFEEKSLPGALPE